MVLLKEVSDGIWGVILGPNKVSEVVTERPFRVTMAALEIDDASSIERNESATTNSSAITRVTIKSNTADKGPVTDLILCNLHFPSCLQQPLDLEFYDGQTITFGAKGPHRVHLTGYLLQAESHEMCEEGCTHEHGQVHHADGNKPLFNMLGEEDEESDSSDDDDDISDDGSSSDDGGELDDDEDQDLNGDYEDGYLEGEDQLSSESSSSSESDSDEKQQLAFTSDKGKKRPRAEANGHHHKQEPLKKKKKKNSNVREEQVLTSDTDANLPTSSKKNDPPEMTSKKAKKLAKKATAAASSTSTAANDSHATSTMDEKKSTEKTHSLDIHDIRTGTGPEAKLGKTIAVYYTGRLKSNNSTFDSCTKGKPFRFRLGAGEVIRGWDQGVKGMRVGGKRRLTIPPSLAYGSQKLPDIPAHSTLIFDIEVKNVF